MTKYYVYTQNFSNMAMAGCYDGYTDNPYLIRKYVNQMSNLLEMNKYVRPVYYNDVIEIEEKSEKSLINLLSRMEIGQSMSKDNKLWSIDDNTGENSIVINDVIYNKFIETAVLSGEIPKIDHDLYRLSRPDSISYLVKYLNKDISKDIIPSITLLYDAHKRLQNIIRNYGELALLSHNRLESELWNIIDEYSEMLRFIQTDIAKIILWYENVGINK